MITATLPANAQQHRSFTLYQHRQNRTGKEQPREICFSLSEGSKTQTFSEVN
jgi:hypothetical protein